MIRRRKVVLLCVASFFLGTFVQGKTEKNPITTAIVAQAEKLIGLIFTSQERKLMLEDLNDLHKGYQNLRKVSLPNHIPPALLFHPVLPGMKVRNQRNESEWRFLGDVAVPENEDHLAFYSVAQLGELIRQSKITCQQLTHLYLERLKKYGPKLLCVITLTEELALQQAKKADDEIAAGKYRGPLHGIPYGAKDLLSTKGIPTTWGSVPYKTQMIDEDAAVIQRLREAGAVLVAKLTVGELAWGDVWFGGMTRNPWHIEQGSSGSSAGSAAATAAGLVAFAIGTETWGSIISPSTRCGTTGLRPTFGRVSRAGAMALSWSMDKIGPICRTVDDCALVFQAIYGPDGVDPTVNDVPFKYSGNVDLSKVKIGYLKKDFESMKEDAERKEEDDWDSSKANDQASLAKLRELGVELIPIEMPDLPIHDLSIILSAEAAAAFDELTRSSKDDLLVRQIRNAWPNAFRASRFIPAVEYVQANRIRTLLIRDMDKRLDGIDVYVAPSVEGDNLLMTNLTGHPCVCVPNGFSKRGTPTSITFCGHLFREDLLLAVAKKYQDATGFHLKHPKL